MFVVSLESFNRYEKTASAYGTEGAKTAAKILRDHIQAMSGAELGIVSASAVNAIYIRSTLRWTTSGLSLYSSGSAWNRNFETAYENTSSAMARGI